VFFLPLSPVVSAALYKPTLMGIPHLLSHILSAISSPPFPQYLPLSPPCERKVNIGFEIQFPANGTRMSEFAILGWSLGQDEGSRERMGNGGVHARGKSRKHGGVKNYCLFPQLVRPWGDGLPFTIPST
jgi:hypothetical protein